MKLSEFSEAVLRVSEKAAQIARLIRSEESLFSLLVEEKTGISKNERFVQDFKTLADVLIQETVRHDLGAQFPGIASNIFGEESNKFTNTLGETVEVAVQTTPQATKTLLAKILDGNDRAAELLANQVHAEVTVDIEEVVLRVSDVLDVADVGVWIDPIDSTAQYIKGQTDIQPDNGVYIRGLQCALVLIGAYDINTGASLMGVLNQPFSTLDSNTKSWTGRMAWGINYNDTHLTSSGIPSLGSAGQPHSVSNGETLSRIVMSHTEKEDIQSKLRAQYDLIYASGAGYKILCVIDDHCVSYVLTHMTTYKWDTCGPQAVLLALGGGILDLEKALSLARSRPEMLSQDMSGLLDKAQVCYHQPDESQAQVTDGSQWKNAGGLLAYRDPEAARNVLKLLSQ